jgi:serralysin
MSDTTAPILTNFTITDLVDTSGGSGNFTVSTAATDESGIKSRIVYFDQEVTYGFSANSAAPNGTWSLLVADDGWVDGGTSKTISIFNTNDNGAYTITGVKVNDHAGNSAYYDTQALLDMGFDTEFIVNISVTTSDLTDLGDMLTASATLANTDDVVSTSYQWLRDGKYIDLATSSTYTLTVDDIGAEISVVASYLNDGGTKESAESSSLSIPQQNVDSYFQDNKVYVAFELDNWTTGSNTISVELTFNTTDFEYGSATLSGGGSSSTQASLSSNGNTGTLSVSGSFWNGLAEGVVILEFVPRSTNGSVFSGTLDRYIKNGDADSSRLYDVTVPNVIAGATPDDTLPELTGLTISSQLDTSNGSDELTISAQAVDASGIDQVVVYFDQDITYSYTATSDPTTYSHIGFYGIYDSWDDGTVSSTQPVYDTNENGTYTVTSVKVTDLAGNEKVYLSSDLQDLGFDTEFTIAGARPDDIPFSPLVAKITYDQAFETTGVVSTDSQKIDALLSGYKWGDSQNVGLDLSYSFPWYGSDDTWFVDDYGTAELEADELFGFLDKEVSAAVSALDSWSNVANVTFTQTEDNLSEVGVIRFAYSSAVTDSWGWAYTPNDYYPSGGDVWVNPEYFNDGSSWQLGSYNFESLIHEVGHAMGLDHPFDGEPTLPSELDNNRNTVMSYTAPEDRYYFSSSDSEYATEVACITPMLFDVLAIQKLYGANYTYNNGDDVYAFSTETPFFQTIWDGDGSDSIDISNFVTNCNIDLRQGQFSSIRYDLNIAGLDITQGYTGENNLAIAYDCYIENAIGGFGDDYITGNSLGNYIHGGQGSDAIYGDQGNDVFTMEANGTFTAQYVALNVTSSTQIGTQETVSLFGKNQFGDVLDGGEGIDTIYLTAGSDAFFLHDSFSGFHSSLTLSTDNSSLDGMARIANIEYILGLSGDDVIDLTSVDYTLEGQSIGVDGGAGNDTIWGSDANEAINGGDGNDEIFGGIGVDILTGGAGADEFQFTKTSVGSLLMDFNLADGDTLKFFNSGGAVFDETTTSLDSNAIQIEYTDSTGLHTLSIGLDESIFSDLTLESLQSAINIC